MKTDFLKDHTYHCIDVFVLQRNPGFPRVQSERPDRRHDREGRRHIERCEVRGGASRFSDEAGTQEGGEGPDGPHVPTEGPGLGENRAQRIRHQSGSLVSHQTR